MKKVISFFAPLFMCLISIMGQMPDVRVEWGPENPLPGKEKEESFLIEEDENGGFYSLRERYKYVNGQVNHVKRYIEHFDKDGQLTGSELFKIKHTGGDRFFHGIFHNEGRMYLVTYHLRRSDKMNVLSVQDIDRETLLVSEEIRAVAEVPYERGLFGFVNVYNIKMVNNRIYAFHSGPQPGSGKTVLSVNVFDKDFNLQWKQSRTLKYPEKLFQPEDFDIDQNGTVRVMATIYKDKKRKLREGKPNYQYHFFVFGDEGKNFKEHSITLGDKLITDMRFTYRPDGDIACAGFYSDQYSVIKTNTIAGAFYVTVDPGSDLVKLENYKAFDQEFLSNFMKMEDAEGGKEIKNINLHNLHFLENGSAILLAEETTQREGGVSMTYITYSYGHDYYTQTTTTMTVTWTNYIHDNIIALRVNPEGMIEWVDLIPKKQHTSADGGRFSSFATGFIGDKIYLIYNDNPKNLTAAPGEVYRFRKKSKESVVVCAEIDYQGNITRKALFSAREAETLACPKSCEQISENKLMMYGIKGKKYKWGILTFE
ncbi:hypothetical protein ACFLTA_05075 [Bacteroidota bacterium]